MKATLSFMILLLPYKATYLLLWTRGPYYEFMRVQFFRSVFFSIKLLIHLTMPDISNKMKYSTGNQKEGYNFGSVCMYKFVHLFPSSSETRYLTNFDKSYPTYVR